MSYTAQQLYDAIQPKVRAEYERAFEKARKLGYVDRLSIKHKLAIIKKAHWLHFQTPPSPKNKMGKYVLQAAKIPREDLYKDLSKSCVWTGSGWTEKWHIASAKDLLAGRF